MNNLPDWPGADACYTKAYRMLERMATNGHVSMGAGWPGYCGRGRDLKGHAIMSSGAAPSNDMTRLIEALDQGNEEQIKGLLLSYNDRNL